MNNANEKIEVFEKYIKISVGKYIRRNCRYQIKRGFGVYIFSQKTSLIYPEMNTSV